MDDRYDAMYPSEEELLKIKTWKLDDPVGCLDYLIDLWSYPDYCGKDGLRYEFSTGGWSGNESLIEALTDNAMMWAVTWISSCRGGHYVFEVPKAFVKEKKDGSGKL